MDNPKQEIIPNYILMGREDNSYDALPGRGGNFDKSCASHLDQLDLSSALIGSF